MIEIGAGEHHGVIVGKTHFSRNGQGRVGMIAGDHLDLDTSAPTGGNGADCFWPRWVDDPHHGKQCQLLAKGRQAELRGIGSRLRSRQSKHAQALVAQATDLLLPECLLQGALLAIGSQLPTTTRQDPIGCTFDQNLLMAPAIRHPNRHQFMGRFEGNAGQTMVSKILCPELTRQRQQGPLGGLAHDLPRLARLA